MTDIIGTVAGDDTVFVATSTERHARSLLTRLTSFGIARKEKA
jgi:arginine repressor